MQKELRETGIDLIGNASWGTHFCQFYQTPEDLIDILVPYFKAGLENNEFCMWITAEPLNAKKAKASLKKIVRNLDDYIEKGQIEILDFSQWYTKSGKFDADEVLDGWVEKEKQALERGFDGLRLTGNTFWLEDKDWRGFTEYEEMINDVIGNYKMLALCSYSLDKCGATEIMDVIANHQFALVKRENRWEIIESSKQKQLEESMRNTRDYLNNLFNYANAPIIVWDTERRITRFNHAFEHLTGLSADEVVGQELSILFPESSRDKSLGKIQDTLSGEYWESVEIPVLRKDGNVRTALWNSANIYAEDGVTVVTTIAQGQDITERKRMEDALQKKTHDLNKRVKELNCLYATFKLVETPDISFDEIIQGVVDLIPLGMVYPENTCSRILLDGKEYKTKNFKEANWKQSSDIFMHDKRKGVLEVYQLEEKPEIDEGPFLKEEKRLISAIVERLGQIIEKKHVDEVDRASRKRYYDRFNDAPIMYVVTENRNSLPIITDVNKMFLNKTGYSHDEVVGQPLDKFYTPGSRYKSSEGGYQRAPNGSFIEEQREMVTKNGRVIDTTLHALPEKDDSGKETGTRAAFIDITESKSLEKQLLQSQKMEGIGRLAGGIAHDFNNLLTTIIGYTELMLMQVDKDSPLRTGMEEIKKASDRAANLTSQLLAFSRKQMIQPVVLNINYPLAEMDKMLRRLIGEDIDLVTILEPELWKVKFDPGQVDQMVINLAVNAKDAMPEGGKLTIETANLDLDEAYARQHGVELKPGPFVMVAVSDTGMGLDEEIQSHIFEPFFTTKETGKGTGLGLSTVYGIVELNRSAVVFLLP